MAGSETDEGQARAEGAAPGERKTGKLRTLIAAGIGTALEGFDMVIFAYMAMVIAKVFFPASQTNALLMTFAVFGLSFVARPLGAMVIGVYGDWRGRRAALSLTLVLMGLGSLMIGLMPSHASIGILAPIGILAARLLQGFAAGAEQGSASVFVAEQDGRRRSERIGWMLAAFGLTGVLAAGASTLLAVSFTPTALEEWAWRLPFLFGAIVAPIGWYIRRRTEETEAFKTAEKTAPKSVREILGKNLGRILVVMFLYSPGVAITYLMIYLPSHSVASLGMAPAAGYAAGLASGLTLGVCAPLMGLIRDRFLSSRTLWLFSTLAIGLMVWPLFVWLAAAPSLERLVVLQIALTIASAAQTVTTTTIVNDIFPVRGRLTAASLSSAAAFTLFGGFAPLIYSALTSSTGDPAAPSYYVILTVIVALPPLFWLLPRFPAIGARG
ncbi:MAG: MFS transporter [Hyphomonadaceae bacterium]|nr:MFS transporter [Hyphomonadaceae bacterium]